MSSDAQSVMPVVVWEALVTEVYGSAPTRVGAQLLLHRDGRIAGNLGGGHLEHSVRRAQYPGSMHSECSASRSAL